MNGGDAYSQARWRAYPALIVKLGNGLEKRSERRPALRRGGGLGYVLEMQEQSSMYGIPYGLRP